MVHERLFVAKYHPDMEVARLDIELLNCRRLRSAFKCGLVADSRYGLARILWRSPCPNELSKLKLTKYNFTLELFLLPLAVIFWQVCQCDSPL